MAPCSISPAALSLALVSAALVLFDMFGNMRGDVSPAYEIHKRYFTRLKTAHGWLEETIWADIDFAVEESFIPNRTKADWPATEAEARDPHAGTPG